MIDSLNQIGSSVLRQKYLFVSTKKNNIKVSPPLYKQFMGEIPTNISRAVRGLNGNTCGPEEAETLCYTCYQALGMVAAAQAPFAV